MTRRLLLILFALCLLPTSTRLMAQQINGDFDDTWVQNKPWTSDHTNGVNIGSSYTQPQDWCVSNVAGFYLIKWWGTTIVASQVEGYNSSNAVKLANTPNSAAKKQIVPGYMALGTTWSTAKTDASEADGGTFGGMEFGFKPDALEFYYKRSHGSNSEETASVVAYLWKGTYKQENVPGNIASTPTKCTMINRDRNILGLETTKGGDIDSTNCTRIASINESISGDASDWTLYHKDFTYGHADETPEMINVIISANDYFGDRTKIGKDNTLIVDNVRLVYYHALSSLSYDGTDLEIDADKTIDLSAMPFDESKLAFVKKGVGATTAVSCDADSLVTITVYGNDYDADSNPTSMTTYKLQFRKTTVSTETFYNRLRIGLESSEGTGYVCQENIPIILTTTTVNGTPSYSFLLENFAFEGLEIGDIRVDNLECTETSEGTRFTGSQDMVIMGSIPCTPEVDAIVKDGDMTATIEIPEVMGGLMDVHVKYAAPLDLTAGEDIATTAAGKRIVSLTRTLGTGWYTVCVPFATTATEWGADSVREFTGADAGTLYFTLLDDATMAANKPYLIHITTDLGSPRYFAVDAVEEATPEAVTYGDFTFEGNYTGVKSMAGLYGVASAKDSNDNTVQKIMMGGANSTLKSTGAFFTYNGSNAVQQYAISFDGQTTSIDAIAADTLAPAGDIYSLQGVKLGTGSTKNLPRGLYIVGGKKVIVK